MINYQLELEKIIEENKNNKTVPTLLLHSCCAPCSSYVLEYLSKYFMITVFYYNPNISSIEEYLKRKEEQIRFINEFNFDNPVNVIEGEYDNKRFEETIKGLELEKEGGSRCKKCYLLRLEETCRKAKEKGFDYFGTTLTVSPYKNSNSLNEIGKMLSSRYDIKYLYSDFKKKNGYKRSIELSRIYNLYRQDYCGCIYSKRSKNEDKMY